MCIVILSRMQRSEHRLNRSNMLDCTYRFPRWNVVVVFLASSVLFDLKLTSGGGLKDKLTGKSKAIILQGQIILGGLFPMHEMGFGGEMCGSIKEEKGIQRVEAMLYAIDEINNDDELLPGVTLGCHILDTCLRDTYALEQSLEFIKPYMSTLDGHEYQCSDGLAPKLKYHQPVAGVVGAAASPVSIMVANMLRLFKVTLISIFIHNAPSFQDNFQTIFSILSHLF